MGKNHYKVVGAIDVGSNYLHMSIAQINEEDGSVTVLEDLTKPTTIGRDTFTVRRVMASTIRDTVDILKGFSHVLKDYKVKIYKAISTSGIREAENRDYVLEHIRLKTGINVEVINNAQEKFYLYKALRYHSPNLDLINSDRSILIVNIATGGVEVSIYDKGNLKLTEYLKIGALRLRETLAELQRKTTDFSKVMEEYIDSKVSLLKPIIKNADIQQFVGLGNELKMIYQLCSKQDEHFFEIEDLAVIYDKAYGMLEEQIVNTFSLSVKQAETFLPSILILNSFVKMIKTKRVYVPPVVLRHGLLSDIADQLYETPRRQESINDIISSVWYIAKKFGVDKRHASHVEKMALSIFDQIKKLHRLGERDRLYLQIASIIHAIGYFVNFSDPDIIAYELILKQSIVGLADNEMMIIANIVRYHEMELPSFLHPNYYVLSYEEKIKVTKLAAILKLADSMDVSRGKKIEQVNITLSGDDLYFKLTTKHDILLEEWAFVQGSVFFEEVMGVRPMLKYNVKESR